MNWAPSSVPSSVWTREQLAWCAGIIEGEGSLMVTRRTERTYPHLRITVPMTDFDVLEGLRSILGGRLGKVRCKPGFKPIRNWELTRSDDAYAVMVALWPWLRTRRRAQIVASVTTWLEMRRWLLEDQRERLERRQTCPRCGGPRRQRLTGAGELNGWRCRACDAADQRLARQKARVI